jgi:hypothetical protein
MAIGKLARGGIAGIVLRWASGLRFPYLFLITALLFGFNLLVPDFVPVVDELIMGLVALTLASLRKKPQEASSAKSPPGNIKPGNLDAK